jgi:DNA-binding NarL/FixJ family response regulator/class 3 adenylate cyclase
VAAQAPALAPAGSGRGVGLHTTTRSGSALQGGAGPRTLLEPVARTLPSGTVSFLFTDIEGSTRLVNKLRDGYAAVMSQHQEILRSAFRRHNGEEVDTQGDSTFWVFRGAREAVAAAAEAQRSLAGQEWPQGANVRVRMGVHTGEPVIAEDRYVGLDVHRAARICDAGHGGQVLLSNTTHALLEGDLPEGTSTRELGDAHLKDLDRPEHLHQLDIAGLDTAFPALNTTGRAAGTPIRVVLADDSVLLREGVARILAEADFEVVGQVSNADDLLRRIGFSKPDVAIVDIRMPPTNTDEGLQAARAIRERFPGVGVLVLSSYVEPGYAVELLGESTEGVGYLLKDRVADVDDFAAAVRRVAQGGSALDPAVVAQLVGRRRSDDPLDELTPREREVLSLMAEGRSNAGIALRMVVTERAVEKHVTSIFAKLGLPAASADHRRVLAVLAFLRQ